MNLRRCLNVALILFCLTSISSCDLFGGGTGVCVSTPVDFSFGLRVYCYSDYTSDECKDQDAEQVNGADWEFHSGQTCDDRGLDEGSNPWP